MYCSLIFLLIVLFLIILSIQSDLSKSILQSFLIIMINSFQTELSYYTMLIIIDVLICLDNLGIDECRFCQVLTMQDLLTMVLNLKRQCRLLTLRQLHLSSKGIGLQLDRLLQYLTSFFEVQWIKTNQKRLYLDSHSLLFQKHL